MQTWKDIKLLESDAYTWLIKKSLTWAFVLCFIKTTTHVRDGDR